MNWKWFFEVIPNHFILQMLKFQHDGPHGKHFSIQHMKNPWSSKYLMCPFQSLTNHHCMVLYRMHEISNHNQCILPKFCHLNPYKMVHQSVNWCQCELVSSYIWHYNSVKYECNPIFDDFQNKVCICDKKVVNNSVSAWPLM